MKKWIIVLVAAVMGAQPLFAQNKISWKELLLSPAFQETQTDIDKKLKQALIRQLQAKDATQQQEGQMRAYRVNPQAVVQIRFAPQSYKAINYNKTYSDNCQALLLDNNGTILLNEYCRKALFHTKDKLAFSVDLNNILPGRVLKITNYPRNTIVLKDNYALAVIPLTQSVKEQMPALKSPIFVAKRDRWLVEGKKYIVPFSLGSLFDPKQPQNKRERMSDSLPDHFSAKVEGFY